MGESPSLQVVVSLMSGLVAGVMSAVVSQPADTILSNMSKNGGKSTIAGTLKSVVSQGGPSGLFRGLGSRMIWSGAIISGQFGIYQELKELLHVTPSNLLVYLDVLSESVGKP
jgi:solute carrier family 25 phosphate transporter 3